MREQAKGQREMREVDADLSEKSWGVRAIASHAPSARDATTLVEGRGVQTDLSFR
jgi:hypothetical protein